MTKKRQRRRGPARHGHVHDGYGDDPFEAADKRRSQDIINRKAIQLCRQVSDTLGLVLAGEFDDELLHNLQVVSVDPAPNASQLAVTVLADVPGRDVEPQQVLERLEQVAGRLRCEVAAAITRKRAPRLVFHVLAPTMHEDSGRHS